MRKLLKKFLTHETLRDLEFVIENQISKIKNK